MTKIWEEMIVKIIVVGKKGKNRKHISRKSREWRREGIEGSRGSTIRKQYEQKGKGGNEEKKKVFFTFNFNLLFPSLSNPIQLESFQLHSAQLNLNQFGLNFYLL